jgi:hypothetical protein
MDPKLDPIEQRVLGSLIEKASTTPEYYPLTLNALRNACNQKSSRNPVMDLDEDEVFLAISSLRRKGLVESVYADGSRAERFRHLFSEQFPVSGRQLAIMCELFLRGPQTPGELNSRASRMASFSSSAAVADELAKLADSPRGAMVRKLERKPGQKDSRWTHLFHDPEQEQAPAGVDSADRRTAGGVSEPTGEAGGAVPEAGRAVAESGRAVLLKKTEDERILHLEQQVDNMRREIRALGERFEGLRKQLDELSGRSR